MTTKIKQKIDIANLCKKVIDLGKSGSTPRVIALEIDLSQEALIELRKREPIFDKAMRAAEGFALGYHEKLALGNLENKGFSSQLHAQLLRANWPGMYEQASYRKEQASKVEPDSNDYGAAVDQLIKDLKRADEI